eukprot:scaffold6421_cov251-Ochromonas_danica.AAC.14
MVEQQWKGMVEWWNDGMMEWWNGGMVESMVERFLIPSRNQGRNDNHALLWLTIYSGELYSLLDALDTECEYQGLTWGSRLADAFNSYEESVPLTDRLSHEFFHESPTFLKLLHGEMAHRNLAFPNSPRLHHHHLGSSAFSSMAGKWIYLLGDHSLFPLWLSFSLYFKKAEIVCESLHPLSSTSSDQKEKHTSSSSPPPRQSFSSSSFSPSGATPVQDGQVCHITIENHGKISFERRDYLAEFWPGESFLSEHSHFSADKAPDIILLQTGGATCSFAHYEPSASWLEKVAKNVDAMAGSFYQLRQVRKSQHNQEMKVIFSLPGRIFQLPLPSPPRVSQIDSTTKVDWNGLDSCHWKSNGWLMYNIHRHHLPVLHREEIEHRLLNRFEHILVNHLTNITPLSLDGLQIHWTNRPQLAEIVRFPGAPLLSATLLEMLHCFDRNKTFSLDYSAGHHHSHQVVEKM